VRNEDLINVINRNKDLIGICGYYILTNNQSLLCHYNLHVALTEWLSGEIDYAISHSNTSVNEKQIFSKLIDKKTEKEIKIGPLYAVKTTSDGNCLLHAVSYCLWGIEDIDLDDDVKSASQLRIALKQFMIHHEKQIFLHYRAAESRFDADFLGGVETSLEDNRNQFNKEIECLDSNKKYLSALHVFCLANMLRRPIIVYGRPDVNGIMRGIYLPTM
jgi:hypothetical protein